MKENILVRTALLDSPLLVTQLADTLRRASATGDTPRVTDQLRSEGVDALRFEVTPDGEYRITPVGLESRGMMSPRIAVEARLRILSGSGAQARVQVKVRLTRGSWTSIFAAPAIFIGFGVWKVVAESASLSALVALLVVALLASAIGLLRARALIARGWPGLLAETRRVADGSLYMPAA